MEGLQTVLVDYKPNNPSELTLKGKTESISQTLDQLFPEQGRDDKDIKLAKQILRDLSWELNPEELKVIVSEVQFLCESWLDDFERLVFNGQTLKEFLHEKGGK
jgi:hypothetical protein